MKDMVKQALVTYRRKTITIEELESMVPGNALSYIDFANIILSLEEDGVLQMAKAKGGNNRVPSLAHSYRIQKQLLTSAYHEEVKRYRLLLHPSIQLDSYFGLEPMQWKQELPYLRKIHHYIETSGFPDQEVPAPERSVELVGDEKWLTDKNGKDLLERIGLWTAMKVIPVSDPLMFAVNPIQLAKVEQKHLIVENKTTYQALLDALPETEFSTLVYGSGNKIIKSIEQFERQLPLSHVKHQFYYFGDIDWSGIFIWHRLNQKQPVSLALPFYYACLDKPELLGKTNQRSDYVALEQFLSYFSVTKQKQITSVLNNGSYYPQEVLRTKELRDIWRQDIWN